MIIVVKYMKIKSFIKEYWFWLAYGLFCLSVISVIIYLRIKGVEFESFDYMKEGIPEFT